MVIDPPPGRRSGRSHCAGTGDRRDGVSGGPGPGRPAVDACERPGG